MVLAQKPFVLRVLPRWCGITVIICVDACPLWQTSGTQMDVFIGVRLGGPYAAGMPANGATWWVLAGADDRAWLWGMDAAARLNSKVEYLDVNDK